ncbi:hypothetical protein [uncultured Deinococcus sp.]|uniref:hypothetical protein n=1 Tax=uncultured Deinococcus sp. TaxID=158789 RepID=UPI0025F4ED07|nr:hypothetical protein [uncultured Deinococcus sp.]
MTLDLMALKREIRSQKATPNRLKKIAMMDVTLARLIARRYHTPISVLEALALHPDVFTRRNVARHPQAPTSTLLLLAKNRRFHILKALASNQSTPGQVVNELARHQHHTVRAACLGNPHLTFNRYFQLAHDPHPYVRAAWLKHELENIRMSRSPAPTPDELDEWFASPDIEIRRVLACHLYMLTPTEQVLRGDVLIQDSDRKIREFAAPYASAKTLESLLNDESELVRTFTAARSEDETVLLALLADKDDTVRRAATHSLHRLTRRSHP